MKLTLFCHICFKYLFPSNCLRFLGATFDFKLGENVLHLKQRFMNWWNVTERARDSEEKSGGCHEYGAF